MDLYEVLKQRGYSFRQHLPEASWTERKLTVVDLSATQQEALHSHGMTGLKRVLDQEGSYAFPSLEISDPLAVRRDVDLRSAVVVAPAAGHPMRDLAGRFVDAVTARCGISLQVQSADETGWEVVQSQDVVLFGASHENSCAMSMALRFQSLYLDAVTPGMGGWAVTTLTGLDPSGHVVVQATASSEHVDAVLDSLLSSIDDEKAIVNFVHTIHPGQRMQEHFPSPEDFLGGLPARVRPFAPEHLAERVGDKSALATADISELADLLALGLNSGGKAVNRYNVAPLDISITCAQYYMRSGDRRALELFRELLFRAADYYLKTPEGASYPSDLDFRLGHMILYYTRLESDPIFSDGDRLILANLLLSCARSVHEYTTSQWPLEPGGRTRHNHETFAGRSLLYAADYFTRHGLTDFADLFRARADAVFSGGMFERFKQKENANHYEHYAFEHGINYSAFIGKGFGLFTEESLRRGVERTMIVCDNFFRGVDYGDASVSMAPSGDDALAVLVSGKLQDPVFDWFADEIFSRSPRYYPGHGSIPGIRRTAAGQPPQSSGDWELLPLDPEFIKDYAPDFPKPYAFDKLGFRTGWAPDDHYLLFEGVGTAGLSHAHLEVNGIVRLNHLGRHWLVSNGYGRRVDLTNVSDSFATRIRGPEDHNTLVPTHGSEILRTQPLCGALLQHGRSGDVLYATDALLGYSGLDWYRTLVILANRFVLVIDRMAGGKGEADGGHIEWQGLGELTEQPGGYRLDQKGVYLDVLSSSGWSSETAVADQSADWKGVLSSGDYPYATFPLPKVYSHLPMADAPMRLATLLAATRESSPEFEVFEEGATIRVKGKMNVAGSACIEEGDLHIRLQGDVLEVTCDPVPALPEELVAHSAIG